MEMLSAPDTSALDVQDFNDFHVRMGITADGGTDIKVFKRFPRHMEPPFATSSTLVDSCRLLHVAPRPPRRARRGGVASKAFRRIVHAVRGGAEAGPRCARELLQQLRATSYPGWSRIGLP